MPLIIITGYPCCGKTTFAKKLLNDLSLDTNKVVLINEESLGINKLDGYKSSINEKVTRGSLKSAVDHALSSDVTVILDSLNYIKGYRYELFCIARSLRTPHVVCWVQCAENVCINWNNQRIEDENRYDSSIMSDLRLRFEAPIEKNKWDNPLFVTNMTPVCGHTSSSSPSNSSSEIANVSTITDDNNVPVEKTVFSSWKPIGSSSSASVQSSKLSVSSSSTPAAPKQLTITGTVKVINALHGDAPDETIQKIKEYLSGATAPLPNISTVPVLRTTANHLYDLDRVSQDIIQIIISHQLDIVEGTPIIFNQFNRTLAIHRHVSTSELQRHKRQFVKANGNTNCGTYDDISIGIIFIDYLAIQL